MIAAKRTFSVLKQNFKVKPGVALDIDGVLLRGDHIFPSAISGLKKLRERDIPFIFLTNGGGATEAKKAKELSKKFQLTVDPAQVVLSHTPMKRLLLDYPHLREDHVLVVGKDSVREVALSYGFKQPVLTKDLIQWNPTIWPLHERMQENLEVDYSQVSFKAVIVLHDSWDWGKDIQIICDILRSNQGHVGTLSPPSSNQAQAVPLFFSNPDFLWATGFGLPRFAQGAFRLALNSMYRQLTGHDITIMEQFGKPFASTYAYATHVIDSLDPDDPHAKQANAASQVLKPRNVYAVGDNILSDIIGANAAGWTSILVKTGVYKDGDDIPAMTLSPDLHGLFRAKINPMPKHICYDIGEAIDLILTKEC